MPAPVDIPSSVHGMLEVPRYPLVFMHGMGITAHLLKPGSVFDVIAGRLRACGLPIYAPRVAPYAPIRARARSWQHHCERILEQDGWSHLNLLGFSTGGLDARYLISRLGGHRYVASLTTLATPHSGSSIAAGVLSLPGSIRRALITTLNTLASLVFPGSPTDAASTLRELMPEHLKQRFNRRVDDHSAVTYFSLAAKAGKGASNPVSPLLWLANRYVYGREGPNDGIVSVRSARWRGYSGYVEADHAQLVGIATRLSAFDPVPYYLGLATRLAAHGF